MKFKLFFLYLNSINQNNYNMDIEFNKVLETSLNNIVTSLDSSLGYGTRIEVNEIVKAKTIAEQLLMLINMVKNK